MAQFLRFALKTSAVWISAVLALLLFPACNSSSDDSGTDGASNTTAASETTAAEAMPTFGQPARDGKFEFVVASPPEQTKTVGEEPVADTAQGVYLIYTVQVTNIGDEAQMLDASSQQLVGAANRQFDSTTLLSLGTDAFMNEINPGNNVTAKIAFDVPEGTQPKTLVLHDSAFSDGVDVNVAQ